MSADNAEGVVLEAGGGPEDPFKGLDEFSFMEPTASGPGVDAHGARTETEKEEKKIGGLVERAVIINITERLGWTCTRSCLHPVQSSPSLAHPADEIC